MILPGIVFDLGDDWQYALESSVAYVPGTFTSSRTFTVDKNGDPFVSGAEYRLWAKNTVLGVNDPVLYTVKVNDDGSMNVLYAPDTTTGSANGNGAFLGLSTAAEGQLVATHIINGQRYLIPIDVTLLGLTQDASQADRSDAVGLLNIRLAQLSELIASQDLILRGSGVSFINDVDQAGAGLGEHGFAVRWLQNGNWFTKAYFGPNRDGSVGFSNDGSKYVRIQGADLQTNAQTITADQADSLFRGLTMVNLPVASTSDPRVLVAEPDSKGNYNIRALNQTQQAQALIPALLPLLLPYLNSTQSTYQTRVLGCVEMPMPAQSSQDFNITSSMIGSPQEHNLQVSGENILADLRYTNGQSAFSAIQISYPDTTHFLLTSVNDELAADFSGTLNLKKRAVS